MPSVQARINVSVDTGDLDQRVGAQVTQLQQVIKLVIQLVEDPPDDVGDLLDLATNLPLPDFSIDTQFTTALSAARDALPDDLGDLTSTLDGDLDGFVTLIEQLTEVLQDSVRIAAAIENLVSMGFSCPDNNSDSSETTVPPEQPASNAAADRMTNTAQQTEQVNELLDRLPPSPTVGGLIEFFFPIIDNKPHRILTQLPLPIVDDIIEPLRTLSRWAAMDATAVGAEIEATINRLTLRLQGAAVEPLDNLIDGLNTLQPQLALPSLTSFGDAYATALNDLISAIEADNTADILTSVADLNLALDNAEAALTAWDGTIASDLNQLCEVIDNFDQTILDRISHLLSLLEPVELPNQLFSTIPAAEPPDPAVIESVQEAVQPVLDWLNEMTGLLDFSSLQSEVSTVATQAQQISNTVEQGLTGVALQVQSLFDDISDQLNALDLNGVRDQLDTQIEQFAANLERQLGDAFTPASSAIASATQTLSDALDSFNPADVVDALRSVLQAITSVLESGEIASMIEEVRNAIVTVTETLEQLSFAPVTDEVVALIEQMTDALRQLEQTDLNEVAKQALAVALEVLPDDLEPVTDPLLDEFGELIDNGPVPLLEKVAEKPSELLDSITQFQPGSLIGDRLGDPYREVLNKAEAFQPNQLFAAINDELENAKQSLVQKASPAKALALINAPFESLKSELNRYSPDALLQPLEDRIEETIEQVIQASPVDEIFEQVNRVFDLIEQALQVPNNLLGTMQRLDALLTGFANSGQQIDSWRDDMLDKVVSVTNLATIDTAVTQFNEALANSSHAAFLSRFNNDTLAMREALVNYNPGGRITELVNNHNRARILANGLLDSTDKDAVLAALDRFEPGRSPALLLPQQLQQCLNESQSALNALATEWQDLVESPDSLLNEISSLTTDANGLRNLVSDAIEPLLTPLRYVFLLLESLQPAIQAMLSTLTELVDQLTGSVAALTTGPGSLQAISDAIQEVVDTLRNIDIGFLRESLQQLFIQLTDQLDTLNPESLGDSLDQAFNDLLTPIGPEQIIPASSIETLDTDYQQVLDKLRALNPETLITEVVQPEYDATVVPLVEAFDLSPAFNALIEFLRGLNDELDSELGRINSAYQGLRAARPSIGSINVNISL